MIDCLISSVSRVLLQSGVPKVNLLQNESVVV